MTPAEVAEWSSVPIDTPVIALAALGLLEVRAAGRLFSWAQLSGEATSRIAELFDGVRWAQPLQIPDCAPARERATQVSG